MPMIAILRPRAATLVLAAPLLLVPACRAQQPAPQAAQPAAPQALAVAASVPVAFPQVPSISPDGSTIVFAASGDLWAVPASGGVAERLTSHPADEYRSAFNADGSMLAFESERDGSRNLYVMPLARAAGAISAGSVRRATVSDRPQTLGGFSADGKRLAFSSAGEPAIFRSARLYWAPVPQEGDLMPGPVVRITDAFGASPHPSPDGKSIVFHRTRHDATRPKYRGSGSPDVFSLDLASGSFTRVTTSDAPDADGFALPDGSVVFVSSRSGQFNLWRVPNPGAGDNAAVQITDFKPAPGEASIGHGVRDFTLAPGGWVGVFGVWDTLYTIDFKQPKPTPQAIKLAVSGDAAAALDRQRLSPGRQVSSAALSPDGKTLASIARGEVFVRSVEKDFPTRRVTGMGLAGSVRARDLTWSPDGKYLYFTADTAESKGRTQIMRAQVDLTRESIRPADTALDKAPDRSAEPAKSDPAKPDPTKPDPAKPDPTKTDPSKPEPTKPEATKAEEKPEADKPADDEKKPAARPARAKKDDPGQQWADAVTFKTQVFLSDATDLSSPQPSPDGKWLLVNRGYGELLLIDLKKLDAAAGSTAIPQDATRVALSSWTAPDAAWAADSRHIVYSVEDVNFNSDIFLLDVLGDNAKPVNLTRHPDTDDSPRLSADGKVLYFLSDRDSDSNGEMELFAMNLDRKLDGLRTYELAEYFKEASEAVKKRKPLTPPGPAKKDEPKKDDAAKPEDAPKGDEAKKDEAKPTETKPAEPKAFTYDAEDLQSVYRRVRALLGVPDRVGNLAITPAGDRVLISASADGSSTLLSFDYRGQDRKTVFAGPVSNVSTSLTGDRVLFVSSGRNLPEGAAGEDRPRPTGGEPFLGRPAGGEAERVAIEGSMIVDIESQQVQKFVDAARLMGQRFYHPTMKGLDWNALSERYLSLARRTRTDTEFNRIFNMLLGELDGSHMGINGGRSTAGEGLPIGYLGIDARPAKGGYEVRRVIFGGPADRQVSTLKVGDVILSVNGVALADGADATAKIDLDAALAGTAGTETLLSVQTPGSQPRPVLITPISAGADAGLRYQDEVRRNAAKVEKLSGGKLGYLHIRGMDLPSARDFERDLFAAADGKDGLIIDVRDNGGGFTADILLSSLTAPPHARTFARGMDLKALPKDAYPRDRRLIYGYSRPINVLINQNSFSNAEIFAHAIKTIKRGTLVGVATFGGVISTGSYGLIDGTTIRTPFRGWWLPGDVDMENNGAKPDVPVPQNPEDEAAGEDRQLEAAVKELLSRAK